MSSIFSKTSRNNSRNKQNKFNENLSDNNSDTFVPKILSIDEIRKIIPENTTNTQNLDLQKTHIEWRWRFFNFKGRNLIEMSKKHPQFEREYVDNSGHWIKYNYEESWDKYLKACVYHYVLQ